MKAEKLRTDKKVCWLGLGAFIGLLGLVPATSAQTPKLASGQAEPIKVALRRITETQRKRPLNFLSILSIKCRNLFYWAENMETEEMEENKESLLFMHI